MAVKIFTFFLIHVLMVLSSTSLGIKQSTINPMEPLTPFYHRGQQNSRSRVLKEIQTNTLEAKPSRSTSNDQKKADEAKTAGILSIFITFLCLLVVVMVICTDNTGLFSCALCPMEYGRRKLNQLTYQANKRNRGLVEKKSKAHTSQGVRKLKLEEVRKVIEKYGKKRAYDILKRECKAFGVKSVAYKQFDTEYNRLLKLVNSKIEKFTKQANKTQPLRKLLVAEFRDYLIKYHKFDISTHVDVVRQLAYHMNQNMPKYLKYLLLGTKR